MATVVKLEQDQAQHQIAGVTPQDSVVLAHQSVREYLMSERIRAGPAKNFGIEESASHNNIAQGCLLYLLQSELCAGPCEDPPTMKERVRTLPLSIYAALCWPYHANHAMPWDEQLVELVRRLLRTGTGAFMSWVQLLIYQPERSYASMRFEVRFNATALYFATSFGLQPAVAWLLDDKTELDEPGGMYGGTPLHAAFWRRHYAIAQMLLDAGANPSIRDLTGMNVVQVGAIKIEQHFGSNAGSRVQEEVLMSEDLTTNEGAQKLLDIVNDQREAQNRSNEEILAGERLRRGLHKRSRGQTS